MHNHGNTPMRNKPVLFILLGGIITCAAGLYAADVMTIGGKKQEGMFEGYANNRILFRTVKGKTVKEYYTRVTKLVFEKPWAVTIKFKGKKTDAEAVCQGFEKSKFVIEMDGKVTTQGVDKVSQITVVFEEGQGGGDGIDDIDTKELLSRLNGAEPTAAQAAAIRKYDSARQKADDFVAKNAALEEEMKRATGDARTRIIEELRTQKHDQEEILSELKKAAAELIPLFPPPPEEPVEQPATE